MHDVWIMSRYHTDSTNTCELVLGVYGSPDAALAAGSHNEHIPISSWQLPVPGHQDWRIERAPFTYTIAHHPVTGKPLLPFTTDLSR